MVGGCAYDGGRSYLGSTGSCREPPGKGVSGAAGRCQRTVGRVKGHHLAAWSGCAAVIGIEGDGVGVGRPLGIEGVVGGCAHDGGRSYLSSTGSRREPPGKGVSGAAGRGQRTVGRVKGHHLAGWSGCAAVIGIEGDSVGLGRPLGVQGDVSGKRVDRFICIIRPGAVIFGVPAVERVAGAGETVECQRCRNVGRLRGHRA